LLTAYLENRPIYVFDEWASDQDPFFREIFYEEILPGLKARGKAVIAITHDEEYYHLADRTIRMTDGRIDFDKSHSNECLAAV
jgi:putative ATP-binding cassette transporter